jgi:ProP effector
MSKTARRARTAAIIELLCDRFPQTFSRRGPQPLKVGLYDDALSALRGAVEPRDLKSALRGYTSNSRYLRALSAGAVRVDLNGEPAGAVTAEDEAVAKKRLADSVKETTPSAKLAPTGKAPPEAPAEKPTAENHKSSAPSAPKRLSLADLREAGRRRREAAA